MKASLLVFGLAVSAGALAAQGVAPAAALSVATTRVRSEVPTGTSQFAGAVIGGEGTLALGRVQLDVSYVQGKVDPDGASGRGYDLVEGAVLVRARTVPWLTLGAGVHARSYTLPGGTQRWVFTELRARAAGLFIGSAVRGYVELWRAIGADVNVPEAFDHAQGGEAGMIVRLSRAPIVARIAYRIDHAVLGGGTRRETVDGVLIGIGVSRR